MSDFIKIESESLYYIDIIYSLELEVNNLYTISKFNNINKRDLLLRRGFDSTFIRIFKKRYIIIFLKSLVIISVLIRLNFY